MRVMDDSMGIWCNEGRVRSSGRNGWKSCKDRGGQITALLSRVPSDTINLTTPEVVTRPKLGRWIRMSRRHGRSMSIVRGDIGWGP